MIAARRPADRDLALEGATADRELATLAATLRVDAVAAEVVGALHATGVRPVLLKGPVLAERLYPGEARAYGDVDLLVAPAQRAGAERVLAALGFAPLQRAWEQPGRLEHDAPWRRPGTHVSVDLHRGLPGIRGVAPETLWRRLAPHRVARTLPGLAVAVDVLDDAGLALLTAAHAAHHLREDTTADPSLADLARAIRRLPLPAWSEAARLAERLRAQAAMARGLHAVAGGTALAERLRLPPPAASHEESHGWARLRATRGTRARLRLAAHAVAPSPAYLRWSWPLARRGPGGLALAYALRPLLLARAGLSHAARPRASRGPARA